MADELDRWLNVGDLDELLREIDRRTDRGDWAGVDEVGRRARAAIERGHQLWPAASWAEYRLALDAPGDWAATVVGEGSGWMAPGPLTEVAAQHHRWVDLAPHVDHGPHRAVLAQERVLRGDDLPDADAGELPGRLLDWEPRYALAEYSPDGARFPPPEPEPPTGPPTPGTGDGNGPDGIGPDGIGPDGDGAAGDAPEPGPEDEDADDGARALRQAVQHWATHSEGVVRAAGVAGDERAALTALGHDPTSLRSREATLAEVGALLAWAASDGGAHGRRRGAAAGRFELWWALAVLAGVEEDWPFDPGPDAAELRVGLWLPPGPVTGWSCRLWVVDDGDGLAWALDASDEVA